MWVADDWGPEHPVAVATSAAVAVYALEHPKPEYQMPDNRCWIPEWAEDAVFYQVGTSLSLTPAWPCRTPRTVRCV